MENALRTKSLEVKEQYEKQLRELQEAYGEAMLELRARNKLASLLGNEDELRSDNGLVFTSRSDTALVGSYGLQQEFITSYSPEQNGMVERVIRTLEDQCVHRHRFETLQHASRVIADWIDFYNHWRPHQALATKTPAETYALAA
ncbi:Integrase catalytic domain-containing protein [Delftia tsuruhatensis]